MLSVGAHIGGPDRERWIAVDIDIDIDEWLEVLPRNDTGCVIAQERRDSVTEVFGRQVLAAKGQSVWGSRGDRAPQLPSLLVMPDVERGRPTEACCRDFAPKGLGGLLEGADHLIYGQGGSLFGGGSEPMRVGGLGAVVFWRERQGLVRDLLDAPQQHTLSVPGPRQMTKCLGVARGST